MMATPKAFEIVGEAREALAQEEKAQRIEPATTKTSDHTAAVQALMLLLKTLSQKTFVALVNLRTLLSAGAVFWLFMSIGDPTVTQLIAEGMFSAFVLAVNWIWRR